MLGARRCIPAIVLERVSRSRGNPSRPYLAANREPGGTDESCRKLQNSLPRALEPETSATIVRELKALGYRYVTIDLQGYRTGSLNEGLLLRPA